MRFLLLFFFSCTLLLISSVDATAQYSEREIGLNTSNLSSIGLDYKKKTGENKYLRLRASSGNFSYVVTPDKSIGNSFNFGMGVGLGFERRKYLGEKTFCIHGFAPSVGFAFNTRYVHGGNFRLNLGLAYMLGIAYEISDKFYTALEINPGINFLHNAGNEKSFTIGGNFNQDFVSLSINYRFNKSED